MAKQGIVLLALLCLMVVYLPFHLIAYACDAVGRHVVHLAERLDAWVEL